MVTIEGGTRDSVVMFSHTDARIRKLAELGLNSDQIARKIGRPGDIARVEKVISGPNSKPKQGRPAEGPPWTTLPFCMRLPLRHEIEAVARREGVSVSCWTRFAARSAILKRLKMGAGDKRVSGWNSRKGY